MVTLTTQQVAPNASPKSPESVQKRGPSSDDREDQTIGGAFGELLAITRGTVEAQIKGDGDRATGQMFDAQGEQAGGDRLSQLGDQYRTAIGAKSDRISDARTGLESRADVQNAIADRQGNVGLEGELGPAKSQDHFASLRTLGSQDAGATVASSSVNESARFDLEIQSRASASKLNADVPPPVDILRGDVGLANASGLTASSQAGSRSAPTVAEEIGQLLGASRLGEITSVRAAAAPPGAADQRGALNDRQTENMARTKQPPSSPTPSKVVRENNSTPFDKLVGRMRLRMSENRSTAQLRLNPPELGRVRVDVRLVGDRLVVGVQAESESARELLSRRIGALKATLKEHGIHVDRLEVVTNTANDLQDASTVGGDATGAKQSSRENWNSSSPSVARVARGDATEDYDGTDATGTAASASTAAMETRLDIRI